MDRTKPDEECFESVIEEVGEQRCEDHDDHKINEFECILKRFPNKLMVTVMAGHKIH